MIVNPTFVLGPDDPSGTSNRLIRRVLLRQIPFYVDGGLNIVDVRDVASGHLLADKKGKPGERYILGGRNFTLTRLFADIGRISGVPPPPLKVPLGPDDHRLRARPPSRPRRCRSPRTSSLSAAQWWTYRSTKAKKELGFKPRPHEETLEDAVDWQMDRLGDRVGQCAADRPRAARLRARCCSSASGSGSDDRRRAGESASPSSSIAAARRPTSSARAARSRGGCAATGSPTGPSGCPTGAATAPRSSS